MVVDRTFAKALGWLSYGILSACLVAPAGAQGQAARGKAELKAGSGAVAIDYGRPSLKGRDMLSQLQEGSYSLWLKKDEGKYKLVFNSQTGQWGTQHDPSKDVYSVAMESAPLSSPVETFTIDLKGAPKGGELDLSWGETKLHQDFTLGK
jgi:hypothetical protein